MNTKRLSYALLPFLFIGILLFITYFGNQIYAETFGNPGVDYSYIFIGFNRWVPFWAWTIYPYIIAYPAWALAFFIIAYYSKRNLYDVVAILTVTYIICGIWYFFWQSDVEAWRVTSGLFLNDNYATARTDLNFTEQIVMWIYRAAGPRNALPSMHTLMSWVAIIAVRADKNMPVIHKVHIWVINILIIVSTQTLKQHYIIDSIVAIALAEAAYWVLRNTKFSHWFETFFTRLNNRLNIDWDGQIKA